MLIDLSVIIFDVNTIDTNAVSPNLFIGLDANIVILGFIVFLIKIMQLNVAKLYLTRIYVVATDVAWLLLFILVTQLVFVYSYNLISHIGKATDDFDSKKY